MVEVKLGLEFNLFLGVYGDLWEQGAITQEGENVLNTYVGLIFNDKPDARGGQI